MLLPSEALILSGHAFLTWEMGFIYMGAIVMMNGTEQGREDLLAASGYGM